MSTPDFAYTPIVSLGEDTTEYRCISTDHVRVERIGDDEVLRVDPEGLRLLARAAMTDVSFYLRPAHLDKVAAIIDDPEASDNDRYVAATLLRNAMVAAERQLPSCQDTGTAICLGYKGERVWTGVDDKEPLSRGVFDTYQEENLRYSQNAPLTMFDEKNTGTNLPAQIDIYSKPGMEYKLLFLAKGGGSANKTFLYQQTKAVLNEASLSAFLAEKLFSLGTSACPPYHVSVVIGGTSAEDNLKHVKLASAGFLDNMPTTGNDGGRAFRDLEWEQRILKLAQESHIGAQFGGKYLAHDVRVIRMPRHGASCPIGIGVSCSADRNIKAKVSKDGLFIEQLDKNPARFADKVEVALAPPVEIDLDQGMDAVRAELTKHPVGTRLKLRGTLIVARDIAHAEIQAMLDAGEEMPQYLKDHPVYYAGPAKTPEGMASGSFGPTTAGRMDSYVDAFQAVGGSLVMLAKGNRSQQVTDACAKHGGFYLGSIGGPAAILAKESIKKVELVAFPELGMEAVRKIAIEDFPAFIIVDDKGNDLFQTF
ncbi:MAG: fumarate hydratase [Planctomycetota bacterium]|jgi:fumarate hydratase class I